MRAPHVLITGVSTRAAADSAARAGFDVVALDAFGDLDSHPAVRALSLPRDYGTRFSPGRAARIASSIASDAVVYLSNFENHPAAVDRVMRGRSLWGNDPAVLRCVRNPVDLARSLRRQGFDPPDLRRVGDDVPGVNSSDPSTTRWLVKPRASGGGHGIRLWHAGDTVPRGHHLQAFVDGAPGSVVFVAVAGRSVPLGVTRQLIGEGAFGASGFRYCGSILTPHAPGRDDVLSTAAAMVSVLAGAFLLVGVGSLDFIVDRGMPRAIEVNPRWTASMELVERAYGLSVFAAHAAACCHGQLPSFDLTRARASGLAVGKAIVFARDDCTAPDTHEWLTDPDVRDVPHPGESIASGQPVCTVFAEGPDEATCYERLVVRAERIYRELTRNCSTSPITTSGFSSLG